jgi:hypothetical protein
MASAQTQAGIDALKAGRTTEARALLQQAVRDDPRDELAWLWLSGAVETDEARREALLAVLALNPEHPIAQRGLAQLPPAPVPEPVLPAPARPRHWLAWALLALIAGAVLAFWAFGVGLDDVAREWPSPPPATTIPDPSAGEAIPAWQFCRRAVTERLKAPSTAEYPWYDASFVRYRGEGRYVVTAYVDAHNGFGAMIRTPFTCTVRVDGTGWTLEAVSVE